MTFAIQSNTSLMVDSNRILLTGTAHPALGLAISQHLNQPLGRMDVRRFLDAEIFAEIHENVRGRDCYVIQPTCTPVNDNLMELLIILDALKRSSAGRITAVVPYFGYSRQDRKTAPRTPISAKLVADLLEKAGAHRVLSVDLHAGQIQGFFNIPFDNLYAAPVIWDAMRTLMSNQFSDVVIVSPDAGGVERARYYAEELGASVAMIDKRRAAANVAKAMNVIGDVAGKRAIILDDMIDTAGTLIEASQAVLSKGAVEVSAVATHGVFSGPAFDRITQSQLKAVLVTDTIPKPDIAVLCPKVKVQPIAPLLAEAIHRISTHGSISELFKKKASKA